MVMVYATGHLSGAHINPAVTLAFTLTRHFPAARRRRLHRRAAAGAVAGALLLLAVWTDQPANLGATRAHASGVGSALVYEIVLTAFLMFVIMAVPPTPEPSARPRRSRSAGRSDSTRCSAGRSPARA